MREAAQAHDKRLHLSSQLAIVGFKDLKKFVARTLYSDQRQTRQSRHGSRKASQT